MKIQIKLSCNIYMKGGSLKPPEIKEFLEASYEENAPANIRGYELDKILSNLYGKVYVNQKVKKVVLSFRGTGMENLGSDWVNNLIFAANSNAYRLTPRYRTALKMYNDAMKKYKGYKFELVGHSQSGVIVNNLCSDKVQNCISLNPAYKNASLKNNEYIIRSSGDVVSKLAAPKKYLNTILYPNWTREHMIVIDGKTSNPITEHKPEILDRLDPNKKIGRGGSKYKLKGGNFMDEIDEINESDPLQDFYKGVKNIGQKVDDAVGGAKPKYPHDMFKGQEKRVARTPAEHMKLEKLGFTHTKPNLKGGSKSCSCDHKREIHGYKLNVCLSKL